MPKKTKSSKHKPRLYRYSDVNTYTDNLTLAQAQDFQRKQNGGSITPMSVITAPKKFLVISVDTDQEQFFYDFVLAKSPSAATSFIQANRPYCQGSEATSVEELVRMGQELALRSDTKIQIAMEDLQRQHAEEEGEEFVPET